MIPRPLLLAAACAALLAASPAEAGVSAVFGGLRPAATLEAAAAVCPLPIAGTVALDEVLARLTADEL